MQVTRVLSVETQKELATIHVRHYQRMLDLHAAGSRAIRKDETQKYLQIWLEGFEALDKGEELSPACISEMEDAVDCGDYDMVLKPEELEKIRSGEE